MPTPDELNEIKSDLLLLGDEPEILASKGESPVDIGPPESGLSDDLNALFDDFADVEEETKSPPESYKEPVPEQFDELTVPLVEGDIDDDEPLTDTVGPDESPGPSDDELLGGLFDDTDEPLEQFYDDIADKADSDLAPGFSEEEDLSFEDLVSEDSPPDLDLNPPEAFKEPAPEQFDELTVPLVEGDTEDLSGNDDLDFGETEDLSFDDMPSDSLGVEDDEGGEPNDFSPGEDTQPDEINDTDDLDFGETGDLSFDDMPSDFLGVEGDEGGEPDEFSSGEDTQPDEINDTDDLDFGETEDLSFDEMSSDSLGPEGNEEGDLNEFSPGEDTQPDEINDTDNLDFEESADLSFDDMFSDSLGPEGDEGGGLNEFSLGEDTQTDEINDTDNFELMGDELDLGGDEELSLDDSDAEDPGLRELEINDSDLDEDLDIDEFDLGDLGQDFGVLEDDFSSALPPAVSPEESPLTGEELEEEEIELSEEAFGKVKATLKTLPLNLRLIIEEEIGEKGLKGPALKKLIDALVEGKSPKEIAAITSKIVGRKIKIPSNFSKRTGLDFEAEKGSFQYALVHNIIPLIKIFLLSSIILTVIGFAGYKFIYKPVHANILYNRGWAQLEKGNYHNSADLFDQAFNEFKMKKQFYRYAEGYIDADQWAFARAQYEKLLKNYPFDKKGTLDYANMEFKKLDDYEHSTEILNKFLAEDNNKRDYDALLLLGDIYLDWGTEVYDRYEDARLAYAKIMSTYGVSNKILFRMLRYFIRTDNPEQVAILKNKFQADEDLRVDPAAYAELAAFQIDHHDIDDVETLLFRAKDSDDSLPEIHYQLARLYRITEEGGEEDKALTKTFAKLDNIKSLHRRNRQIKIDALRRQGERFYIKEEYLQAEEDYQKGINLLKESRERNIIKGKNEDYGKLYADLGDIYYYISQDPDKALDIYETAENEDYHSPEIYYNKGNIRYRHRDFRMALLDFYNSAGSFSVNSNLLYATGNTLYMKNDYFAAQGYYNHLLDILEQKLSSQSSIEINEREDQRMLVESLMEAYNNMGVTLYGLFQRTGDPSKFTAALLNFTKSNKYFDDLTRNSETLQRTEMINLASLNQRKMLYPIPDYELQIFADIPKRLNP